MLSGKSGQSISAWWDVGKQQVAEFLKSLRKSNVRRDLIGLVINPQYLKLLKIKRVHDQYEVEYFNIIDLPEGLMNDLEIRNTEAIADLLKEMISHSGLKDIDVVFAIPRSSTIVKTITVDNRLHPDEIKSRVWLETNRLFPNLIGEIYLDFVVNGPSTQDPAQHNVLIVACRKDQLRPYLDIMDLSGLTAKVVDVNYYAYERSLFLITKHCPEIKTLAFLNINFSLIDLLVVHEGQLVYTHELTYDGQNLLKLRGSAENDQAALYETLKNTISLHLKHTLQFFYSSKPNVRLERIILGGDVPASIAGVRDYVQQEIGKEVVLADPFIEMKLAPNVDKDKLQQYTPALMLCCGLALTRLGAIQNKVVD